MLLSVGLPISHKENERRRALVPEDVRKLAHPEMLYVENGYGDVLGYCDECYSSLGVNFASRAEVLSKDIICDPKVGDSEYLGRLSGQVVFGWIHAVQNREITDALIGGNLTAYAWEDMYEDGRHLFWRNNEIAGEAAVFHAYMCHGIFPYHTKAAVLGRGNTARGAIKTLNYMGADVTVYDRKTEDLFRKELPKFDVVVNSILWDTSRKDHILYRDDLKRMKPGSMIIDISCDRNGGIETSVPTTIENPIYIVDGITHYVVDHTPSLFWKSATESLSAVVVHFLDELVTGSISDTLLRSKCVEHGEILDPRILSFQKRAQFGIL